MPKFGWQGLVRAALVSGALIPAVAAPARAATLVGQTGGSGSANCPGSTTWVQAATAQAEPSYAVPATGGVITSWSHDAPSGASPLASLRLKIFRRIGTRAYTVVGHSAVASPVPGPNTFPARIRVQAGDLIGLRSRTANSTDCVRSGQPGDVVESGGSGDPDPPAGTTFNAAFAADGWLLNLAAVVEPDRDSDGYGDETQDACPFDPAHDDCKDTNPPQTRIVDQPPNKTRRNRVRFAFRSDEAGSHFQCRLDRKAWKPCSSPTKLRVDKGEHLFRVRAIDLAWNVDPTPARDAFKARG